MKILFVMPRSGGDVLQSTAVCNRIKKKYPDCELYFGVDDKYKELLEGCPWIDHILKYDQRMDSPGFINNFFDITYTPHLYLQYLQTANWIHKGHTDKNIIDQFAWFADVEGGRFDKEEFYIPGEQIDLPVDKRIVVICSNSTHEMATKRYSWWQDVVTNLERILPEDYTFVQVGTKDEALKSKRIVNMVDKTNLRQLNYLVSKSDLVLTVDSYLSHAAYILRTPVVSLYGSTFVKQSGLVYVDWPTPTRLIQAPYSNGCEDSCYKNACKVNQNCIDNIDPEKIFTDSCALLNIDIPSEFEYKKEYATISGYTTVYNGITAGFPFIECIQSMLGFCDEVVVVEGESIDGTYEKLQEVFAGNEKVQIYQKQFDWSTPGIDGEQKSFSRALCSKDFCWQQDADEVVHEDDYIKIKELTRVFPKDVDILHLPVVDYFCGHNVSTDYHAWKWRLSRNKTNITHGIPKQLQVKDESNGKIYSKQGSDGCDYTDIVTENPLPHKGFWSIEMDRIRITDPEEYIKKFLDYVCMLPSPRHYSWFSLKRKIDHFKKHWDTGWANLYNETPTPRFTEGVDVEIKKLIEKGGCHDGGLLFDVSKQISHPKIMDEWIKTNS